MTGILFIGGRQPDYNAVVPYLSHDCLCVAADSGYDYAAAHDIPVSCIIGDMDSVKAEYQQSGAEIVTFLRDKNHTDTEIGLAYLYQKDCSPIVLIGGGGGRLDHVLQLCTLFSFPQRCCSDWHNVIIPIPDMWITDENAVYYIPESHTLHITADTSNYHTAAVSIFLCGGYSRGVCTSSGLFWQLNDVQWNQNQSSISNKMASNAASITAECGAFICILPLHQGIRAVLHHAHRTGIV